MAHMQVCVNAIMVTFILNCNQRYPVALVTSVTLQQIITDNVIMANNILFKIQSVLSSVCSWHVLPIVTFPRFVRSGNSV